MLESRKWATIPIMSPVSLNYFISVGNFAISNFHVLAMTIIAEHKEDVMAFSDARASSDPRECGNVIEVREERADEDFEFSMQTPHFDKNVRKPIVIRTNYNTGEDGAPRKLREVQDWGGPRIAAVTSMLDKFVYPRLKQLTASGLVHTPVFGFSDADWERDLITSGKVSGMHQLL